MKRLSSICYLLLFVNVIFAQNESTYKAYWDNGAKIESSDGNFKIKFGGLMQYDVAAFMEDDAIIDSIGASKNGLEFRRVQFFSKGQIYNNIKYKVQFDFAGGKVVFKDICMIIAKIPVIGNIHLGHFKEPISFEEQVSSKYITFMERSLTNEDEPSRNTGFMISNSVLNQRLSYFAGVFKDVGANGNAIGTQDKYNVTMRLIATPIYKPEDRIILHLGAAASIRNPQEDIHSIDGRPESHLANKYLTTGDIDSIERNTLLAGELAFISGPFSLQAEYVYDAFSRSTLSDPTTFYTYYADVSYFLTGESKKYKTIGTVDRISPKRNFDGEGGAGAWELALRYSSLNLNNGDIQGGKLIDITFALNWYLNPSTRIMMNYINANLDGVGRSNIFQMRFQVDF